MASEMQRRKTTPGLQGYGRLTEGGKKPRTRKQHEKSSNGERTGRDWLHRDNISGLRDEDGHGIKPSSASNEFMHNI